MRHANSQTRAYLMLGLVMLFWAGNSIVGRAVRFDIPPFTLALFRWAGALALVAPFALPHVRRDWSAIRKGWGPILALGLIGVASFNALLYTGLRYTQATNALLIQALIPMLVLALDRLIFRTRPLAWQVVGVVISTLGVALIVFRGDLGSALRLQLSAGDAILLVSVLAWALYTVLLRLRPQIDPLSFIFVTFAIGVLAMAPLAVWEAAREPWVNWSLGAFGAIAYVAVLPSLAAYFMYNAVTAELGPARAGQGITLMPLFGAVLSTLILGESLFGYHLAGMALILGGIMVSALAFRGKTPAGAKPAGTLEGSG